MMMMLDWMMPFENLVYVAFRSVRARRVCCVFTVLYLTHNTKSSPFNEPQRITASMCVLCGYCVRSLRLNGVIECKCHNAPLREHHFITSTTRRERIKNKCVTKVLIVLNTTNVIHIIHSP